jgi:copper chaperone CopZ
MKKAYKIEVDCPTCAAKLEKCAKGVNGVQDATVNMMTNKLTITAEADQQKDIISTIIEQMKKIDDDVVIYA